MKIAFRTSGGRGEYELAGKQGNTSAADIVNCVIDFQVSPHIIVPGNCSLRTAGGKPRIRLESKDAIHAYRWLSALLLLRKPNRIRVASPPDQDHINFLIGYQVSGVRVDVAVKEEKYCQLRPTALEIHQGKVNEYISIPERIGRIQLILADTSKLPKEIEDALVVYGAAIKETISHKRLEQIRDEIYKAIEKHASNSEDMSDSLTYLEKILHLDNRKHAREEELGSSEQDNTPEGEDDPRTEIQVRSDYIRSWRKIIERGHQGRVFSRQVIEAYDSRCVISGKRLPRTSVNAIPGVDAAHILPWAKYDLNKISNGVCLSKTYHWAFDSGILSILFDTNLNSYKVAMEDSIKVQLRKDGCDLELFEPCLGVIPEARLPKDKNLWPNPVFLDEFNKLIRDVRS